LINESNISAALQGTRERERENETGTSCVWVINFCYNPLHPVFKTGKSISKFTCDETEEK
jgi:hypothetical protein